MSTAMKERIIDGASKLFSKKGYSGVRVEDIAEFVRISKKTIYNHFPNKFSLIEAAIDSNASSMCKKIDEFGLGDGGSHSWIKNIFFLIVFCGHELTEWVLPAGEYRHNNLAERVEKSLAQIRRKIIEKSEMFLDEGMGKTGVHDDISCRALFSLSSAVVEGVFHLDGLRRAVEIEQNPLICSLKNMADACDIDHAALPVAPETGTTINIAATGTEDSAYRLKTGGRPKKIYAVAGPAKRKKQGKFTLVEYEQRIKELEKESAELRQVEEDLRRSKDRLSLALETSEAMPWEINLKTCKWHCDPEDYETYGYETKEEFEEIIQLVEYTLRYLKNADDLSNAHEELKTPTHPDDYEKLYSGGKAVIDGKKSAYEGDFRMLNKDDKWIWYYGKAKVTGWDKKGNAEILSGIVIDITERKKVEETLREREAKLASQTHTLEETNTALKVLLKNRDEDKKEFEEKIITNLKEMVFPFINKLKSSRLNESQTVYLDIVKSHLDDMTAPFLHQLSSKYSGLTPAEVKVAVFVKEGKTTKEIADLLNSSVDSVSFHRNNLRKKFGLVNSKTNLRTHLLSIS